MPGGKEEGAVVRRETVMRLAKGAAAVLSGAGLWAAFPPQAQADSAWMALVPVFLVIRHSKPNAAAGWGWLAGMIFWVATLGWFPAIIKNGGPWALVFLGQVALAAWCALYLALFACASSRVWQWAGPAACWRRVLAVLVLDPLLWAFAELARGWLFSGFAWNFLGVSQVANLPMIQTASVAGVYGVSALVVLANGAVTSVVERASEPFVVRLNGGRPRAVPPFLTRVLRSAESLLPLAALMACWCWGLLRVQAARRLESRSASWRVALVQPDSPCVFAINDETMRSQLELLVNQTRLAGAAKLDLAVWPETAVLGSVPDEPGTLNLIRSGAEAANAPLLTGTLETEKTAVTASAPEGLHFYNAAWLFSASGEAMGRYRKRHLVPFGEYIPLDKRIPVLQRLAPTGVSCTPGRGPGVLRVVRPSGGTLAMGPLICFEDTVPALSRAAVRGGARLLVLMTNDAWFNGSVEPVQHLNQSVFRAVENGVPLIRAANSGVTCVVDVAGGVKRLESGGQMTDFSGFLVLPVAVPETPLAAPYTRWGDGPLAVLGTGVLFALFALPRLRGRRPACAEA